MSSELALDVQNLTYHYKSNWSLKRKVALHPLTLQISEGESFGFLGHNGAGKTTTIKCLLGLIKPSTGNIKIFGKNTVDPAARTAVGYIPEHPYFYDNLSVRETLVMFGRLYGVSGKQLQNKVHESASIAGIEARLSDPLRNLSKGLTQRVALAQALLGDPRLLILDEPFSGLDPIGRKEFREIFFELKQRGTTLFLSSHVLSDVEHLCDRVSILVNGQLRGLFNVRDIPRYRGARFELALRIRRDQPAPEFSDAVAVSHQHELVRYEFPMLESAKEGLSKALSLGLEIESYQVVQGSLEELFVELVGKEVRPQ